MRGEWSSRCAIKVRGIRRPRVDWSAIFLNFQDNLWCSTLFSFQRQWLRLINSVLRILIGDFHDFIQKFQVERPTKCAVNGYFTVVSFKIMSFVLNFKLERSPFLHIMRISNYGCIKYRMVENFYIDQFLFLQAHILSLIQA